VGWFECKMIGGETPPCNHWYSNLLSV
jgi:hypothetical protein